ncbi:MAG: hypothetical protein KC415_17710 [Anaerolineales bacterium]|nr:hypothetical protein [Anaerolineales bacterium]
MQTKYKILLRNFLIEILVYTVLLIIYFGAVLRILGQPLNQLFHLNPVVYAIATLLLIVVQGVFLEWVTSFLITRLGLEKME